MRHAAISALAFLAMALAPGCQRFGPEPETVPFVDVDRYTGKWHEIASNPVFFNRDLVGVTAEYAKLPDGRISVRNCGYKESLAGEQECIEGSARVGEPETNSKLGVRFPSVPFSSLFEGEYWIVLLGEAYDYAVVTDSRQSTLFVLFRAPTMPRSLYDDILARLTQKEIDISRLRITGGIDESN